MSEQYPGGFITKVPPTPAGPYSNSTAQGLWNLSQQAAYQQQGLWPTPGNINPSFFIENLFSTYVYTGTTSAQTFNNGINLSANGGLLWIKRRNTAYSHYLTDSAIGVGNYLSSNSTGAQNRAGVTTDSVTSFNTNGFSVGADASLGWVNNGNSNDTFVSWTFRKQPKFFDVQTTTISGTTAVFNHNLGSTPGCVIVKSTTNTDDWAVWHRSFSSTTNDYLLLDTTDAVASAPNVWSVNSTSVTINYRSAGTYVAYIFAHNAGGFGLTGTDNVITCGQCTSGTFENLGYEPQWVLVKSATSSGSPWRIYDNMRDISLANYVNQLALFPNASSTESSDGQMQFSATGFKFEATNIYIAIRRGPMAVPTDATKVFAPITYTGNTTARTLTTNFTVDLNTSFYRPGYSGNTYFYDRLRGSSINSGSGLLSSSTAAEVGGSAFGFASNTGIQLGTSAFNGSGETYINYMFQRAPSFFDEVCYTGTGSATTQAHNLGVVPELMIVKCRSGVLDWTTYQAPLGASQVMRLNSNIAAFSDSTVWDGTTPTSSVFSIGNSSRSNDGGSKFVVYLFATCPGVSKVGSYTGTGATQTINCGFIGGARFVLIKRTDSTGDWYVWDTARGMVSGTDPYLLLDTTAAEVNANNVYTTGVGFQIVGTGAGINASGGSYIYLAIA